MHQVFWFRIQCLVTFGCFWYTIINFAILPPGCQFSCQEQILPTNSKYEDFVMHYKETFYNLPNTYGLQNFFTWCLTSWLNPRWQPVRQFAYSKSHMHLLPNSITIHVSGLWFVATIREVTSVVDLFLY